MPIYQFQCPACGDYEEVLQPMDAPAPTCLRCAENGLHAPRMEKQLSAPGFRLKGDGAFGRGRV